jgi:hypothetical protein
MPALLDTALKATVLLAVACALTLLLRRASAAARHLIWALAVVGVLAVPVLGLLLPRWQLPVTSPWAQNPEQLRQAVPAPGRVGRGRGRVTRLGRRGVP